MAVFVASLNTGSNANCFYIGNANEAILIDAGLSCKETEIRMSRLGLKMASIKAIFVSHEHTDHIRGLNVLSKKYQLPIYITQPTMAGSRLKLQPHLCIGFKAEVEINIGALKIIPFSKLHDAAHPHSFVVCCNQINIGIFTDIGATCHNLTRHFATCHAVFLETNYDEDMLANGPYPYFLKQRIRGGKGHLSNAQALALFKTYRAPFLSHVFLSHLSKDNNCPDLVKNLFDAHANGTEIIVASRCCETALYQIGHRADNWLSA